MKRGEIQQRLADTNRWWSDAGGWTRYDPDLKEAAEAPFSRPYTAGVLDDLTPGGLYVLRGPRRVGKSVEVKRTIERLVSSGAEPRRIVHMSVDGWRAADLGRLAGAAAQMTPREGPRWWFIDEITGITDGWPEQIKWLRDNDRRFRADTVVLTGSSSSRLRESVGVLAGRRGRAADPDRVLLPMGFRSFARLTTDRSLPNEAARLRIAGLTPPRLAEASYEMAPWLHTLAEAWEDYLQVGGFPLAVAGRLAALVADQTLEAELLRVISGDAFSRSRISDLQTNALLRRLTDGLGSPVNAARLARELDLSQPTAQRRIDDLREAFAVWPCPRESEGFPNLRAQQKLYFTDPVYTRLASGARLDLTALSEQQLGMALLRSLEREHPGSYVGFERVLHYRSKSGAEIDFVGRDFGGAAVESKYVDGGWRGSARTIEASGRRGIVATRSEIDLDDPRICAVPASMLAWLLDD